MGGLDFGLLRDECERQLVASLQSLQQQGSSDVTLVFTHRMGMLLSHVFQEGLGSLQNYGMTACVELSEDPAHVQTPGIVYLSFASVQDVRVVAAHVSGLPKTTSRRLLLASGRWTALCDHVLDQYALDNQQLSVGQLALGCVPLDSDLLTLGYEHLLYDCCVGGDKSSLTNVAAALHGLQDVYGAFAKIKYKGELAMLVLHQMMELSHAKELEMAAAQEQKEQSEGPASPKRSRLDTLVLLDRRVDLVSALSTPLTYEALLDELLGIHDGIVQVPSKLLASNAKTSAGGDDAPHEMPMAFNADDRVFQQIRDLNVHVIPGVLNAQAAAVKASFTAFQTEAMAAEPSEVTEMVKAVPQMKETQQAIEQHINLLEHINGTTSSPAFRAQWTLERTILNAVGSNSVLDQIQELIFRHEPLPKVLRLLCLYSVVNGGLLSQDLERLKLHLVRAYGQALLFSFDNFRLLGLLQERDSQKGAAGEGGFDRVAELLGVIDLEVDPQSPKSMAFVTSGYAPISCRLVEELLKESDWLAIDQAMAYLPGPRAELSLANSKKTTKKSKRKKRMVVCFVGGVTFMELAALRWISTFRKTCNALFWLAIVILTGLCACLLDLSYEIIVVGTSIINGSTMLSTLLEPLPSPSGAS